MLDNIASERDTALNDLRRAGGGGAGDDEDEEEKAAALATAREEATTAKEEVARLAQECDDLRKEVGFCSVSLPYIGDKCACLPCRI